MESRAFLLSSISPKARLEAMLNIEWHKLRGTDVAEWETKAKSLAAKYLKNFEQYCDNDDAIALIPSGPQL